MLKTLRSGAGVLGLAFVAFFSLGLPDGVLGVAWPSMRAAFDVPIDGLGALLVSATTGYLASSLASGWLVQRMGIGTVLTLSSALMVANSWGYTVLTVWWAMIVCALLAGLGAGAIDAGINSFAATRFSAGTMTWLHACYGAGASVGPVLMTVVLTTGLGWRWGYGVLGLLLSAMAAAFLVSRDLWHPPGEHAAVERPGAAGVIATLTYPPVWPGILLFFSYTGLEVAAGQWSYSLLIEARHVDQTMAGAAVAGYWGSFTVARLVAGAVVPHVRSEVLLRGAVALAPVGAVLVWWARDPASGVLALMILGIALAPVYPLLMAETPRRLGSQRAVHAVGFQVTAAYLGAAAIPGAVGVAARWFGIDIIGPALFLVAVIVFVLHETTTLLQQRPAPIEPVP